MNMPRMIQDEILMDFAEKSLGAADPYTFVHQNPEYVRAEYRKSRKSDLPKKPRRVKLKLVMLTEATQRIRENQEQAHERAVRYDEEQRSTRGRKGIVPPKYLRTWRSAKHETIRWLQEILYNVTDNMDLDEQRFVEDEFFRVIKAEEVDASRTGPVTHLSMSEMQTNLAGHLGSISERLEMIIASRN